MGYVDYQKSVPLRATQTKSRNRRAGTRAGRLQSTGGLPLRCAPVEGGAVGECTKTNQHSLTHHVSRHPYSPEKCHWRAGSSKMSENQQTPTFGGTHLNLAKLKHGCLIVGRSSRQLLLKRLLTEPQVHKISLLFAVPPLGRGHGRISGCPLFLLDLGRTYLATTMVQVRRRGSDRT